MQTAVYRANVPTEVRPSIMGRKVRPTRKFEPQLVAVAIPEPVERTDRGKSLKGNPVSDMYFEIKKF